MMFASLRGSGVDVRRAIDGQHTAPHCKFSLAAQARSMSISGRCSAADHTNFALRLSLKPTARQLTSSPPTHQQPQSCLTTAKSRSRARAPTLCFPRRSPRRLAASSCSTRFATAPAPQRRIAASRHRTQADSAQWSYEEVEVRDISLTYVT